MKRALALVPLLLLCACGGDEPVTPQSVAEAAGCTGFHQEGSQELYVEDAGGCRRNGDPMLVYTFADNEARDGWIKVARGFGTIPRTVSERAVIIFDSSTR